MSAINKKLMDLCYETLATPSEIKKLLKSGADVNTTDKEGNTPLLIAVKFNHCSMRGPNIKLIYSLIHLGADLNYAHKKMDGETPLICAAMYEYRAATLLLLLKLGADVNKCTTWGFTPLMSAAASNTNPQVINLLLKFGADINATDEDGGTAVRWCCGGIAANPKVLSVLLSLGADPNLRSKVGVRLTPLMHACMTRHCNYEVISVLLQNGADATLKSTDGDTAFDYATKNKHFVDSNILDELKLLLK